MRTFYLMATLLAILPLIWAIPAKSQATENNIAEGQSAWASSHENGDVRPVYATDGDMSTRWSSLHQDGEWIVVDLTSVYTLKSVVLNWEDAYASDYEIQVSDDANVWSSVYHESNSDGGTDNISLSGETGQFIRILANSRATEWGVSLFEIEAYGERIDQDTTLARLEIIPDTTVITVDETVSFEVKGYNQYEYELEVAPVWSSSGDTIDSDGVFTPSAPGTYTVTVTEGGVTASAMVTVIESLGENIALQKPATASSLENGGFSASNANDGSLGSRWSSAFSDDEWISIDLEATYSLEAVRLFWESSYTEDYEIQVSDSGNVWNTIHHETSGEGKTEIISLNGEEGRFLRILLNERATEWGNSLYEIEAYGEIILPEPVNISISPVEDTVSLGGQVSFSATGLDQNNNPVEIEAEWSVSGGGTIDSTGAFVSDSAGVFTVTATAQGLSGTATIVVVDPAVLTDIQVKPDTILISLSETADFDVTGYNGLGDDLPVNPEWSVSGDGSIDSNGVFTPASTGTFQVEASEQGLTGTAVVKVIDETVLTRLEVIPGEVVIGLEDSIDFEVTGYNGFGDELPVDAEWSAGSGSIDSNGIFIPDATGTFTITATADGITATGEVTVKDMESTLAELEVSPQVITIMLGNTVNYTATGYNMLADTLAVNPSWSVNNGGTIGSNGQFTGTSIGTYTITAEDQGVTGTATVMVIDSVLENIALQKSIWASSHEDGDVRPVYGNDGDLSTRWSSLHQDGQWIVVDFGGTYNLSEVVLNWEAAYANDYEVQISDNAGTWTTLHHETNGQGGTESMNVSGQGRFMRIYANSRATQYGVSLYEIEAYGHRIDNDTLLAEMQITPDPAVISVNDSLKFEASGVNQYGYEVDVDPSWSVVVDGTINSDGVFTPAETGTFTVIATDGAVTARAVVTVIGSLGENLALNKPVIASTENGGYPAENANDGSLGSRWSSAFADDQWITVDLNATASLEVIRLHWESSHAADYEIQVSDDGTAWTTVHHETESNGGMETIVLNNAEGQYVRMYANERATEWGNSLYEIEVYGTVNEPVSLDEQTVTASPVPFIDNFTLRTEYGSDIEDVTIKDPNGMDVPFTSSRNTGTTVDIELDGSTNSGLYLIYVQTSQGTEVLRVLKQ